MAAGIGWYGGNASISRKCKVAASVKERHVSFGLWLQEVKSNCGQNAVVSYSFRWDRVEGRSGLEGSSSMV